MRLPILLEQIRIDSPCEMPWDAMHGDDRSRFCEKCNLHVHNLSAMTSDAAERLVGERTDRICVAYAPTAGGTPITLDYEKRKRRFTWKLTLLVGIFGAGATAWAQAVLFRTKPLPIAPPTLRGQVAAPVVAGGISAPRPPVGMPGTPTPAPGSVPRSSSPCPK